MDHTKASFFELHLEAGLSPCGENEWIGTKTQWNILEKLMEKYEEDNNN